MAVKKLKTSSICSALGKARTAITWLYHDVDADDWMDSPLHPNRADRLRAQRALAAEALSAIDEAILHHDKVWKS